jgi:hypothetical protein
VARNRRKLLETATYPFPERKAKRAPARRRTPSRS